MTGRLLHSRALSHDALEATRAFNAASLRQRDHEEERKERLRQLNAFYGPIQLLLRRTKRIREELGRSQQQDFRLLLALIDQGVESFSKNDRVLISELVHSTAALNKLIQTNVALIEDSELLAALQKATVHFTFLLAAYRGSLESEPLSEGVSRFADHVFPAELHEHVDRVIAALRAKLSVSSAPIPPG